MVELDVTQSIGRRYRRQDEIGTPYCVTVDFDTLDDHAVTVRDRDTMEQDRVSIDKVEDYLAAPVGLKQGTKPTLRPYCLAPPILKWGLTYEAVTSWLDFRFRPRPWRVRVRLALVRRWIR